MTAVQPINYRPTKLELKLRVNFSRNYQMRRSIMGGELLHNGNPRVLGTGPFFYKNQLVVSDQGAVFKLKDYIGQGGMAFVYQAEDIQGNTIALKVPKPVGVSMLKEEGEALRDLAGNLARSSYGLKNAPGFHGAGIITWSNGRGAYEGIEFVASSFIDGVELEDELNAQGTLEPRRAVRIILELARLLAAAGVGHHDIKPGNIMLTRGPNGEEVPVLLDFGLAKLKPGDTAGTPHYMSNDQMQGLPLDSREDIYQLTATLFQLLSGQTPFADPADDQVDYDDPFQVQEMIKRLFEAKLYGIDVGPDGQETSDITMIKLLETVNTLEELIIKGLRSEKEDRFLDFNAFIKELEEVDRGLQLLKMIEETIAGDQTAPVSSSPPSSDLMLWSLTQGQVIYHDDGPSGQAGLADSLEPPTN